MKQATFIHIEMLIMEDPDENGKQDEVNLRYVGRRSTIISTPGKMKPRQLSSSEELVVAAVSIERGSFK
jgi:hypothetical protein